MRKPGLLFFVLAFVGVVLMAAGPASAAVSVSGYVKLDIQHSDKILGGGFPSPGVAATPLDTNKDADNNQTLLDARQSRIRATFDDTVAGIKMSGRIEGDFFTGEGNALTSNSRGLRLRHAYGRADHPAGFFLLAGQYWSLYMNDTIASPNIIDFSGPAGQIFARQPQLRAGWTSKGPMGTLVLEGDIEKHSTNDRGSAVVNEAQGEGQKLPLLGGKVSWLHSLFQAEAALMVGNNTVILVGGKDESEGVWAFQVSAQATITPVTLVAHFQSQKGLGRLINQDFPSAFLVADKVENVESTGFYVGASFALNPDTSINGYYGWAKADEIAAGGAFTGASIEEMTSIHLNIIQKFWKNWQWGVEYQRYNVEAFNGTVGDVSIIQGAIWYFF